MKKNLALGILFSCLAQASAFGAAEYLVRFGNNANAAGDFVKHNGGRLEMVSEAGNLYKWTTVRSLDRAWRGGVQYIEKNKTVHLFESPSLVANRQALIDALVQRGLTSRGPAYPDNPAIQAPNHSGAGSDPLLSKAWGIGNIGADSAWNNTNQGKDIIVAVTDSGVDYNHEDLINQMWRNAKEIDGDGIDNDGNGYVDDIVGWDFATNDNKPYDLSMSLMDILTGGGNAGHGTHVSGVVGAQRNNGKGTAGVAPQVKIMGLRFITEKGQGTTDAAIKAIDYAVKMKANIINASWGGEKGDDGADDDKALTEAIQRAADAGVIFVAAAGNGRSNGAAAAGFDNDNDPKPMIPASLPLDNIITVAAYDSNEALAAFSNWGAKSVAVGAPGVKVLSTVPGSKYQDSIIDLGPLKATWDGTSMAAPFVAGSLAVIWSQHPGASWKDVKQTLLSNAKPISALAGKVSTGGKVDLHNIN